MPSPSPRESFHVIIVDDNRRICQLLTTYLQSHGHRVEWLDDGRGLLAWLELNPGCDVVVLDLDMPLLGGMDLIGAVRAAQPRLPVLVCTGAGFAEDKMRQARDAGATGYVSKGLRMADTLAAIHRVVAVGRVAVA